MGTGQDNREESMREEVIRTGNGTPIFLVPRDHGGLLLAQGRSHILLSREEISELMCYMQNTRVDAP
jgi:hypothetical protein